MPQSQLTNLFNYLVTKVLPEHDLAAAALLAHLMGIGHRSLCTYLGS